MWEDFASRPKKSFVSACFVGTSFVRFGFVRTSFVGFGLVRTSFVGFGLVRTNFVGVFFVGGISKDVRFHGRRENLGS